MLETPIDVPHVWLGVAIVSLAVAGVGTGLPTGTPPDAVGPANAVDRVAASDHPATAQHPIAADEARIGPHRIGLRDAGGTARASFAFGPVTPVGDGPLRRVLEGAPPDRAFESPGAMRRAADRARRQEATWRPAGDRILVRSVSWGGVNVTLVGA